jgi:hypothetical protein
MRCSSTTAAGSWRWLSKLANVLFTDELAHHPPHQQQKVARQRGFR